MSRCGCICILNGIAVFVRRINLDVATDIARIFLGILLQLFHHYHIMVILALSHFDQTVVASRRIRVLLGYGYGLWSLRIVISRAIGIGLAVRTLFPFDGIARDIAHIVAESNCARLIGRRLIADSRAIGCGDDCLMASGQSTCCVRASRTASNAYRRTATHRAVVDHLTIIIVSS